MGWTEHFILACITDIGVSFRNLYLRWYQLLVWRWRHWHMYGAHPMYWGSFILHARHIHMEWRKDENDRLQSLWCQGTKFVVVAIWEPQFKIMLYATVMMVNNFYIIVWIPEQSLAEMGDATQILYIQGWNSEINTAVPLKRHWPLIRRSHNLALDTTAHNVQSAFFTYGGAVKPRRYDGAISNCYVVAQS